MKTKIIFRGVAAALTSLSLLLSGMPVMARSASLQSQSQLSDDAYCQSVHQNYVAYINDISNDGISSNHVHPTP